MAVASTGSVLYAAGGQVTFSHLSKKMAQKIDNGGLRVLRAMGYMARAGIAAATMRSEGPKSIKVIDSGHMYPRSTGHGGRRRAGVPLMGHYVTNKKSLVIHSIVANLYDGDRTLRDGSKQAGKGILTETGERILRGNMQRYADDAFKKVARDLEREMGK